MSSFDSLDRTVFNLYMTSLSGAINSNVLGMPFSSGFMLIETFLQVHCLRFLFLKTMNNT